MSLRIKNLTPFPWGPKLTSRKPAQVEMAMVVRGAFRLQPNEPLVPFADLRTQGSMKAEEFLPDDDDRRGESLYPGDFADFKLRGEVFLRGTCHTPGGKPMKESQVRFTVGRWSKTLQVFGQRFWSDGLLQATTEPMPFTAMPLRYANAYGGSEYAKNPVGKGHGMLELPTIEHPGALLRSRGDRPEPAGFGPISSYWPQRSGKLGHAYGAAYRKVRAPFYAEDFDWSHFNAAPLDQQLDGYLRGDEELSFLNLHPEAATFSVRLPGLRIRAFVKDDEQRFREVPMVLDTLFADTDDGVLFLTWRGLTPVKEEDFRDIKTVLVASEPLAEPPRTEAHYREILEAFEKDPLGIEEALQKNFSPGEQEIARAMLRGEPIAPKPTEGAPPAETLAQMAQKTGGLDDTTTGQIREGIEKSLSAAASAREKAGTSVGPTVDPRAILADALRGAAGQGGENPAAGAGKSLGDALNVLKDKLAQIKKVAADHELEAKGLERLDALLADPRLRQIDPSVAPPGEAPPPPGPGVDCSGRNLREQDFSGQDLSGINLENAILSGAKLRGANLKGANLKRTLLDKADLTEANLEGAVFVEALLTDAVARDASFKNATLERSILEKADLSGANLEGTTITMVLCPGANLTGARAPEARFYKLSADKAKLERADFSGAHLTECYFLDCEASGLVAKNATLARTSFAGSVLRDATFVMSRGEHTIWRGAKLDRTDFSVAVLPWAHFDETSGTETKFYGTNLKEARFSRASLERADFTKANLFGADFSKAVLTGTRFTGANLYDAKLFGASGAGTDFTDANLKRTQMERG